MPSPSAQDQLSVSQIQQDNISEATDGQLATASSGNLATAEFGGLLLTDHSYLTAQTEAYAQQAGASVSSAISGMQLSTTQSLASVSGAAFDQTYLSGEVMNNTMSVQQGQTEISSGSNTAAIALNALALPFQQQHLLMGQILQAQEFGGTVPAYTQPAAVVGTPLAPSAPVSAQDQAFLTTTGEDGLVEINAGTLAEGKAADPATRLFGQWMILDHTELNAQQAALATAGGGTVPTAISAADQATLAPLQTLTGAAFDLGYLGIEIVGHETSVAATRAEIAGGSDPALVAAAQAALPVVQAHLGEAVTLYAALTAGLTDTTAAPNTTAGQFLSNLGSMASTAGSITLVSASGTAAPATVSGTPALYVVDTAQATIPAGLGMVVAAPSAAAVTVTGGAGAATVLGGASGLTFYGGTGTGEILTGAGANSVTAASTGSGNLAIVGTTGKNTIFATSGADTIAAGTGANTIGLGSGSDVVISSGTDTINGGSGAALVFATAGTQSVFGGAGGLTFVSGGTSAIVVGGTTAATLFGGAGGTIQFSGATSGNLLVAGAGGETLSTAAATGVNVLFGGTGRDFLAGGAGNDTFVVGSGNETLTGGGGANLFQFINGATGGGTDIITDFGASSANRVNLSGFSGNAVTAALATEKSGPSGTSITLADNTTVVFQGVATLSGANFV